MLEKISYFEDFYGLVKRGDGKIVAYGLGDSFQKYGKLLPLIDYYCDKRAQDIKEINGNKVYSPEELESIQDKLYMVIFIENSSIYEEVIYGLNKLNLTGKVTSIFGNKSFGLSFPKYAKRKSEEKIKINIVYRQDGWIFGKFANKLKEYLEKEDVEVSISPKVQEDADINHHIPYMTYEPLFHDTLMVTHIISARTAEILKKQLEVARVGICMSKETRDQLIAYGIPAYKLCYINPAQDNVIEPHKYHIGITHRRYVHADVRKRETALLEILDGINPKYFKFSIMGAGWEDIIEALGNKGFEVIYYHDFVYEKYIELMHEIDYYLYMGFDEGSMGYLDALRAGVGTIVTPQGYHLDVNCEIDYPCRTVEQFKDAFMDLQRKREKRIKAVLNWNWENYAKKHLEIWKYILRAERLDVLFQNQLCYEDGIYSLQMEDVRVEENKKR